MDLVNIKYHVTVECMDMILKRIVEHSARWNFEANTWWVGETEYYCWTDMKEKEESPRMRFSEALQWLIRHDQEKFQEFENPQKIT